ncbi:glycosyltransferase family 39 protein [bacterium]|nr:glycosyltransferase family 39 protein [bacterium]
MFRLNLLKRHSVILMLFYSITLWFIIPRAWLPSCQFNRYHLTGNTWTEKKVLYGGECFDKYGFIKCRFLRVSRWGEKPYFYTHYPPLPSIINGLLRKVGFNNLFCFRLFSVFLSFLMLTMLYFLIKFLFNDASLALIGTIYAGLTPYFLFFADNVGKHLYNEFFMIGTILFFILFDKKSEKKYLILTWVFAFLLSLTSYGYIPFILVFFWGYYFILRKDWPIKYLLIFSSSIFCGLFLHFAQNVWALGSIKEAFLDHKIAFCYRTTGKLIATPYTDTFPDLCLDKKIIKVIIPTIIKRIEWFFSISPIVAVGSLSLLPVLCVNNKEKLKFYYKILGLLFFCGILWWGIFIQHTAVHGFTAKRIALFMILAISILIKEGGTYVFKYQKSWIYKIMLSIVLLAVIIFPIVFKFIIIYYNLFLGVD